MCARRRQHAALPHPFVAAEHRVLPDLVERVNAPNNGLLSVSDCVALPFHESPGYTGATCECAIAASVRTPAWLAFANACFVTAASVVEPPE